MDGTKYDVLYEDFLGNSVADIEDVVDNDGYADHYDHSYGTHEILDYDRASFFADEENDLRDLIILVDRIHWQANTSEVDLDLFGGDMPEGRIVRGQTLSAGLNNT